MMMPAILPFSRRGGAIWPRQITPLLPTRRERGCRMATGTDRRDAVIVGGGHNGLVCAWYLAKAKLNVTICEARPIVGGAAGAQEFNPGFGTRWEETTPQL